MTQISSSILRTVCYADVFSYPLTISQIQRYLISKKKVSLKQIHMSIRELEHVIVKEGKYVRLREKDDLIPVRKQREYISREKQKKARVIAHILGKIPFVLCVGISGSLSMANSDRGDDIDFFIITKSATLWQTRFLVTLILYILRVKRKPFHIKVQDTICVNMYMTEDSLRIHKSKRNLFTAHEVIQLRPLINKHHTYERFLRENTWISTYLGNFSPPENIENKNYSKMRFLQSFLVFIDHIFFKFQYWYMKRKITREFITQTVAQFHPIDRSTLILHEYNKRVKTHMFFPKSGKIYQSKNTKIAQNPIGSCFTPGS